jgi:hypothetical protein
LTIEIISGFFPDLGIIVYAGKIWHEQSFLMMIVRAFQKRGSCPVAGRRGKIPVNYLTQSF